jgi:hypothetical protein
MSVFRKLPPIVPVVEVNSKEIENHTTALLRASIAVEQNRKLRESFTGLGHQMKSDAKHLSSVKNCLEQSVRDLKYVTPLTEVLDIKADLNKIIERLSALACAAEESYNQND